MYGLMTYRKMASRMDISVDSRHAEEIYNELIRQWHGLSDTRFFWTNDGSILRIVAENQDVAQVCEILDSLSENF